MPENEYDIFTFSCGGFFDSWHEFRIEERDGMFSAVLEDRCSIDSRFVMVYGYRMSDGSAFAPFASYIDEGFAREHDRIIVYRRTGEVLELEPVAVDVVNASRERLVIDQEGDFKEMVEGSDLILEEPREEGQLFAFTTCSYQTVSVNY